MKKYILTIIAALTGIGTVIAQSDESMKYRRSQIMINHREQKFANDIQDVFMMMPVSEHFNDHDLSVKVLDMDKKLNNTYTSKENTEISKWLTENKVASRLVAKWFDRDYYTGKCDMELVKQRGLYNASAQDIALASRSIRGNAMLEDAGEDLIRNTFVIVNDIRYIDQENKGKAIGMGLSILGGILGAATNNRNYNNLGNSAASLAETLKGFRVKINTYLYKLDWNDSIAAIFYQTQYGIEDNSPAKEAFEKARDTYHLTFVGKQESNGSNTSFLGVNLDKPTAMVRKACQRAVDENVANLQHNYEEFRTKSPLLSTDPITVAIGLKEGITSNSRFEVLEAQEKSDGSVVYRRVGVIQPVAGKIWDNRYMASEEGANNANLGYTTFRKVSGGTFYRGMLVRETR